MGQEFQVNKEQPAPKSNFRPIKIIPQELANQGKLIIQSFGLKALTRSLYQISNVDQLETEKTTREEGNRNKSHGYFGLPVFDVLTFAQKDYETLDKEQVTVNEFSMGIALIEVSQQKNIVTTPIQGRDGTVKEYIAMGDYIITIRGVLSINAQDTFPEEATSALIEFCKVPDSIQVGSNFLSLFGITDIVITNFSFPQEEGMRNIQRFTIEALSDYPQEIKSKKQ